MVSVDQMSSELGYTRSKLYRYLKVLTDNGLLSSGNGNGFSLGPRIVELHARLHTADPFLLAGRDSMARLADKQRGFALLCRRYRNKVLCVHAEAGPMAVPVAMSAGRYCNLAGHPHGRVVLARMQPAQARRIYTLMTGDPSRPLHPDQHAQMRAEFRQIRDRGFDLAHDLDGSGIAVVSVPVLDPEKSVIGSLAFGMDTIRLTEQRVGGIVRRLDEIAQGITARMLN